MSDNKSMMKEKLFSWVATALESENLKKYEISLDGGSDEFDGYIGEIFFVKAKCVTSENTEKMLHLVVKHSKQNSFLRKSAYKLMFGAEIQFYDKVWPVFQRFQLEKNIEEPFRAPKCLQTILLDDEEVLVLDNLKVQGYQLCDRKKPLNLDHMKTVLRQYGRLHALSFALKDQKKDQFNKIVENYPNFMGNLVTHKKSKGAFGKGLNNALKIFSDNGEGKLAEKFKAILKKDPADIMAELVEADEPQSVIVHGDAWSNNYMFKYKDDDRTSPCHLRILDWQVSHLRSPAIDLSYFFYNTASSKELEHFEELMKVYHNSLSSFLRALGSNPEVLFPFSDLRKHWRKYSLFGLIFASHMLAFVLCDEEDAPRFEDLENEDMLENMLTIDVTKNRLYFERFRDAVRHYLECTF